MLRSRLRCVSEEFEFEVQGGREFSAACQPTIFSFSVDKKIARRHGEMNGYSCKKNLNEDFQIR